MVSILLLRLLAFQCQLAFVFPTRNTSFKCKQDVEAFLSDLNSKEPNEYALKMYDAIGKLGSNVLSGNMDRLGSYSECLSTRAPMGRFQGQYCKVHILQDGAEYSVGVCVPDSCTEEDVTVLSRLGEEGSESAVSGILRFRNISFLAPSLSLFMINSSSSPGVVMATCAGGMFPFDTFAAVCLFFTMLGLALPLIGTIYVVAAGWMSDHRTAPTQGSPLANYGSLPLEETERKKKRQKFRHEDCLAHLSGLTVSSRAQKVLSAMDHALKCCSWQKNVASMRNTRTPADTCPVLDGIRVIMSLNGKLECLKAPCTFILGVAPSILGLIPFSCSELLLSRMGGLRAPVNEHRLSPLVAADSLLEQVQEDFSSLLPEEFITLSPPNEVLEYQFGLEEENIRDLFDSDFGDLTPLDF